jgi:hypothetical protein
MNISWIRKIGSAAPYIDFVGQTIFMMGALLSLVIAASGVRYDEWLVILLWAQMYLGPWQMLSCLVSILIKSTGHVQKRVHFVVSILYLTLLTLGVWSGMQGVLPFEDKTLRIAGILALTIPSWILGTYYYVLTWRIVFPSRKKHSSFLPHINF